MNLVKGSNFNKVTICNQRNCKYCHVYLNTLSKKRLGLKLPTSNNKGSIFPDISFVESWYYYEVQLERKGYVSIFKLPPVDLYCILFHLFKYERQSGRFYLSV